jgi:hypothetical protein
MRKIFVGLVWVAVAILVLFNIALLWGTRLPREHVATRTLLLSQSPQNIFAAISDIQHETSWRTDLKSVERLPDQRGMQVWRENYKSSGSETLATEQSVPPVYMVRTIADDRSPVQGSWEFAINPTGSGTTLQLTERGRINNPFWRFMASKVFGHSYIDDYLKMLAAKFGEKPRIS